MSCHTPAQQSRLQVATDAAAAASLAAATATSPLAPALSYEPYMVPPPIQQPDGTTLYAGDTAAAVQEPLIDLQGPPASGTHSPAGYGGSQCSTAATMGQIHPQELGGC